MELGEDTYIRQTPAHFKIQPNIMDVSGLLSPYHLVSSDDADKSVLQLEKQILFPSSDASMPFSFVADQLENAYETPSNDIKRNTAVILTQDAIKSNDNPALELFALLRLCLPSQDNRSVYGFKTHRLIKSFAKALDKCGGLSGKQEAAKLMEWIKQPVFVKRNNTLISMPEVAIARAHAICFPSCAKHAPRLTIRDVGSLSQRLTNMYKEKHKEVVVATGSSKSVTGIKVDKIAEVLATVLPRLDYTECKVLVRLLLRTVTMGIGVKTFMGSLGPGWENRLDYQMDLGRLSMDYIKTGFTGSSSSIVCCVPFRPMTCDVVSSPYVMKWLFGREEKIKSYLPPKDGRLVVHSNGRWYVPLKRSNSAARKRFIDLETDASNKYTQKHMRVLRELKKHRQLFLNEKVAYGMVISYILSENQAKNSFLFLVRGMKTVEESEIEFVDADVEYDAPTYYNTEQKENKDKEVQRVLLREFVISPDKPQTFTAAPSVIILTASTILPPKKKQSDIAALLEKGMIVQRKYDGDRMQAHLSLDQNGKPKVRLFSKRGKPVHHLYTDVAKEMEGKLATESGLKKELPCILDGEIIVVNSDENRTPLPWSSTKWRYDSGRGGVPLARASSSNGVVSIITEGTYGENLADGEDAPLSLATLGPLKAWDQLGSNEKEKIRVKTVEGGRLLYVIFDMVMLNGKSIATKPYVERLRLLKELRVLSGLRFSSAIEESYWIQNAQQLVMELSKAVKTKSEGLILKDPAAAYVFGKTPSQRKLKICGPDINCAVGGLGFTLSKNPRMWGILTAVFSEDMKEFLVYNRVESIEGDLPCTAAEHILSLPSCVSVNALMRGKREVDLGKYVVQSRESDAIIRVTWLPKEEGDMDYECTLCFACGLPQDIQWLCNPLECTFGVSQRGDLHPVSYDSPVVDGGGSVCVPRFPVCRIQLDDHQRSECDTPSSIAEKFRQAAAEATCIQGFLKRRVMQLRSKPPRQNKLEELRRILLGKENQNEPWPQVLDSMYRLDEFSKLLEKNEFEPLTQGERHVLGGGRISSQWDPMLTKKIQIVESEESLLANEKRNASSPFLSQALHRFKQLKSKGKLNQPIISVRTAANISASTALFDPFPIKGNEAKSSDAINNKRKDQDKIVFTLPLVVLPPYPMSDADALCEEEEISEAEEGLEVEEDASLPVRNYYPMYCEEGEEYEPPVTPGFVDGGYYHGDDPSPFTHAYTTGDSMCFDQSGMVFPGIFDPYEHYDEYELMAMRNGM